MGPARRSDWSGNVSLQLVSTRDAQYSARRVRLLGIDGAVGLRARRSATRRHARRRPVLAAGEAEGFNRLTQASECAAIEGVEMRFLGGLAEGP